MVKKNSYLNTRKLITSIWNKLTKKRKFQIGLLFLLMLLTGFAEVINLSAVIPFLVILTDTDKIWNVPFIKNIANFLGIFKSFDLVIPITIFFSFTAILTGVLRILNLGLNTRVAAIIGNDLSREAYRTTLLQPYLIHVQSNSSKVVNNIVVNIGLTVKVIDRCLAILSSLIVVIYLFFGLLIFNKFIAIVVGLSLFGCYLILSYFSKIRLKLNSKKATYKQGEQIKLIQESLGSIKDVILFNSKRSYLWNYNKLDESIRFLLAQNVFLATFPRYAIESLALFILILSSLLLRSEGTYREDSLVLLGVLALAAQRILPNLQQIYNGLSMIRANSEQAANVIKVLYQKLPIDSAVNTMKTIKFSKSIKLDNISFKYSEEGNDVIQNINIEIFKGENIGIIGKTGSGKSTLIDIILGLLKPYKGSFLIDSKDIHDPTKKDRLIKWHNTITFVPQNIYLTDNSIKENIAFGLSNEQIDINQVLKSAKQARIHDFIESNSNGYESKVGERGIKLSGGQVQRIGIARALYKNSDVVIFDEATSALDNQTEIEVIKSIRSFNKDCTIIMIAHRLSTLAGCDRIIDIESGTVKRILSGRDFKKSFL